jgi:predicted tellurium resistance membrane protein TerC
LFGKISKNGVVVGSDRPNWVTRQVTKPGAKTPFWGWVVLPDQTFWAWIGSLSKTSVMEFSNDLLVSLLSLTAMELVLGIDNIIFISILTGKLPADRQARTRNLGIGVAVVLRVGLLFAISWIMGLQEPLLTVGDFVLTGKDLVLFFGGVFLTVKTVLEIYQKVTPAKTPNGSPGRQYASVGMIVFQIVLVDLVFSVDSILTAVGLVKEVWVMVVAVLLSTAIMLLLAGRIHTFIQKYPGFKLMALLFLIIIGAYLIMESLHLPVIKAYLYFSMAFGLIYEALHIRYRKINDQLA